MPEPIDPNAGWTVLTTHVTGGDLFEASLACRAVFDRLPEILGDLCAAVATSEDVAWARLRIALDVASIDALRDDGFRFAKPPSETIPFLLVVNGNKAQRDATVLFTEKRLTIGGILPVWPQMLVWFTRR